MKALFVWLWF